MQKSFSLFFKAVAKKSYVGIIFVFLDLFDLFNLFIKPALPTKWRDINMPTGWGFILFGLIVLWASFMAYHDLRKKKMDEFLEYAPEFKKDRIFRMFYELLKEGKFLKNANTDRRQRWDEDVLKEMGNYCTPQCKNNYLLSTGRRYGVLSPLHDNNYDKALDEIDDLINRDFNIYVK